jgi:hypothetical protein
MTRTPLSAPESAPYRRENLELGEPLSIREVAALLGCSVWSVRQRLLPNGLPHFRSGPSGKLVFFRQQVVAWILAQQGQMKGGVRP